jgi:hypothetical protein
MVVELCKRQQLEYNQKTSIFEIVSIKNRPTNGHSIELRSGLHGLVPLLGELVLESFLLSRRRLTNLLELSLKVDDPLLLLRRILQQVGPALGTFRQGLSRNNKVVSHVRSTHHQKTAAG